LSNTLFDTTRANAEDQLGLPIDIPCRENRDPRVRTPFKGNMDIGALEGYAQGLYNLCSRLQHPAEFSSVLVTE
jgi:tryptophanase